MHTHTHTHTHIYIYIYIYIYPTLLHEQDVTQDQFFKQSLSLNSKLSFSLTRCYSKAKEISLLYYLPIAEGRMIRFIPFPRLLPLCEMQTGFELGLLCLSPTMVTIKPEAPLWWYIYIYIYICIYIFFFMGEGLPGDAFSWMFHCCYFV